VNIKQSSPQKPFKLRYATMAIAAVVVIAAVVLGVTVFSGSSLPV